ncbi:ABC transporter permease [Lentibacter sp. XHP0401]|uniref:ABC transporter permease n=1 Tax=Lentibacter sp. XHP0401 TaxID=2984334 RepID=UPI0021E92BDB|nr:ABC transporter permease [Lentibacter sp. XHP0401]MCV2894650.1 ABC transporter permease [Lentibacter sp. XHP0401]
MLSIINFKTGDHRRRDALSPFVIVLPLIIAIFLAVVTTGFLTGDNLANLVPQATPLLILSLGLMFPVLTGGIDISNGALVSVVAAIMVSSSSQALGIGAGLCVALLTGLINGIGVTVFRVHPIVMTLGMMIIFTGAAPLILPDAAGQVQTFLAPLVRSTIFGFPVAIFWAGAAIFLAWGVIARSSFGLRVYAVGANDEAVWLSGINSRKLVIACYVISSLSAMIAAMFIFGRVGSSTANIGDPLILNSITAVAIGGVLLSGGVGSVAGVVCGVAALTFINNGMNHLSVDPFLQRVITGIILLGAIAFQKREDIGV